MSLVRPRQNNDPVDCAGRDVTRRVDIHSSTAAAMLGQRGDLIMPLVVTSASGVNGDGYGGLLAFDIDGSPRGVFSDDARIIDPRGLTFLVLRDDIFHGGGARCDAVLRMSPLPSG